FASGEPAPAPIERSFAGLDTDAPPGLATGVVASQTRKIVLPGNAALWIAPTSRGGFCLFVEGGGGQCDTARALKFWPTFSIGGDFSHRGVIENGPSTGLAPCLTRGGGDACLKAAFGSGAVPGAIRPDPDPPSEHFHGQLPWRGR